MVALGFILLQILVALFAPWIAPYDPYQGDFAAHLADAERRALARHRRPRAATCLRRLIYGARISISVGILSQLVIVLIGLPIGALAGLLGGWVDYVVMRVIDVLSSIPTLLFYILLMVALGAGLRQHHHRHGADRLDRHRPPGARPGAVAQRRPTMCGPRARWAAARAISCGPTWCATP